MGSETEHKIPIVDLRADNLKPGSEEWSKACREVRRALEEYGCFEAVYDKIPEELHQSVFSDSKDLFDLPLDTKMQKTSERPYHSYFGQFSAVPRYESMAIDDASTPEGCQKFTDIMWPSGNPGFCENAKSMAKILTEVYEMATRMMFDSYGLERLFSSNRELTSYLMRFFKYRTRQENEGDIGLPSHVDRTFMSIIHQHQLHGLQVKTKEGLWIDIKPSPTSFLIQAGDILGAWSNGRIHPCEHQVTLKENKDRYSIGLFTFIKGVFEVPEELVDEEHPLLYKAIDNFDWVRFIAQRKAPFPIKDYFGV